MKKPCCCNVENLEAQETGKVDLAMLKCRVCGCRHFELSVDPGKIGIRGSSL